MDFSYPNGKFYTSSDSISDVIQSNLNGDKKAHWIWYSRR